MRFSSTVAGWVRSVGPSVFIGLADGKGYDVRDSFVEASEAMRFDKF
jgi:hypothetical protein